MHNFKNLPTGFKRSLLALAVVAVTGCSSSGSSSQPLDQDSGTPTEGTGDTGGSAGGDSGGDTGGGSPTYGTVNPVNEIQTGEVFELDNLTFNATGDDSGATINSGPTVGNNATITVLQDTANGNARLRLQDPDNGLDVELFEDSLDSVLYTNGEGAELELWSQGLEAENLIPSGGLSYAAFGFWSVPSGPAGTNSQDVGFFAGGYDTELTDMPTTGSASFAGMAEGFNVPASNNPSDVIGDVTMDVDFAAGSLTGAMTMQSGDTPDDALNNGTPWNDVSFSGTITDNSFAGSTQVTSSPDSAAALDGDATGGIDGRFYGPQAEEAAGTWSLEDGSGGKAFGAFGVKKP